MSDSPMHTNLPAAPPGPIPPHARCIACRYDLAGLSPEGLCPECAAPIEMTLEHLRRAADIETPLREMALGLGAIKIAYIIAAANAALIAIATLVDIGVVWALMAFLALLSSLLIGGALISGHAAIAIRLPTGESARIRPSHSALIGIAMYGCIYAVISSIPLAAFVGPLSFLLIPIAALFGAGCILFGMVQLSKAIERHAQPRGELHTSRIVAYGALGVFAASICTVLLTTVGALPSAMYGFLHSILLSAAISYFSAHLMLTITLSRAIQKAIRDLPAPAPPGAL